MLLGNCLFSRLVLPLHLQLLRRLLACLQILYLMLLLFLGLLLTVSSHSIRQTGFRLSATRLVAISFPTERIVRLRDLLLTCVVQLSMQVVLRSIVLAKTVTPLASWPAWRLTTPG